MTTIPVDDLALLRGVVEALHASLERLVRISPAPADLDALFQLLPLAVEELQGMTAESVTVPRGDAEEPEFAFGLFCALEELMREQRARQDHEGSLLSVAEQLPFARGIFEAMQIDPARIPLLEDDEADDAATQPLAPAVGGLTGATNDELLRSIVGIQARLAEVLAAIQAVQQFAVPLMQMQAEVTDIAGEVRRRCQT